MSSMQRPDDPSPILPSCGMIALFLHQVENSPSHLAFVDATEDTKVTYLELLGKVKKLAREIRKPPIDISLETPIAILAAKGLNHIIAQLATVFVGGTCVPLDPSISDDQIRIRLQDAQPVCLLVDAENKGRDLGNLHEITVAHQPLDSPTTSDETCIPKTTYAGTRSHIFYTSGTTGKPKGVQVLARGLYRMREWSKIRPSDRVGHVTNPTFDISTIDIWTTLTNGATIVNFNKTVLSSPFTFAKALKKSQVSWMTITTGIFNIVAFACPEAFSSVDILATGGEAANAMAMKLVLEHGPPRKLINVYGPTECSVWSTYHEVSLEEAASGNICIGRPIVGTDVYVLNPDSSVASRPGLTKGSTILSSVPSGSVGELCLGGACLAVGYLNRPDLTEKIFVTAKGLKKHNYNEPVRIYRTGDLVRYNEAGILEYIGRKDNQVKVHGFRVELEGIEAAITNNCAVSTAAVLKTRPPESDPGASAFLLAYIVLKPEEEGGNLEAVSAKLKEVLPWYSIPRLKVLDRLPLNTSAKVDRKKLADMYFSSIEQAAAAKPGGPEIGPSTMQKLEAIWQRTLAHPPSFIKPADNYFSLGGTSLQSATLILKIRKEFGVAVTTNALYRNPTLSSMAEYLDRGAAAEEDTDTKAAMQSDALLSESLRPLDGPIPDWRSPGEGNVFVTGATGYLGAYLVHSLLRMPEVKKIQCLIRARDSAHALSRMMAAFPQYGVQITKRDESLLTSKLTVIPGDLGQENLGLSSSVFQGLASSCSAIFHFGAAVNYVQPYSAHRAANTIGTLNIIRLGVTGRPKTIHYSSSYVVHGPTGIFRESVPFTLSEDEPLEPYLDGLMYDLGYAQSQWVAEQLLWKSIKKGIPIAIYRPGVVLGHTKTGYGNPTDFMGRLIISCIKMGTYPLLPKQRKEFIPVDHCIRDILQISYSNANLGKAYAIVPLNSFESVEWNDTFRILRECGNFDLKGLPLSSWISQLQLSEMADERLLPLMPLFTEKVYKGKTRWEVYENMAIYGTDNTRRALKNSKNPEGCSPLTKNLLMAFLKGWFHQTNNLPLMNRLKHEKAPRLHFDEVGAHAQPQC
ncbi:hypothetical protein TWF481_004982 [Arthrobotrys musiformis]|uniref:Carrier domain-containing protein n=1 Tax=Arthrobotrys musiformis TaxID=47236 RepID=A0AAV9WMZ9_9PEZI